MNEGGEFMINDPRLVKFADFVLWLGSALSGAGTFYFLGPLGDFRWSFACLILMILFLSFRDCLVGWLRSKTRRSEGA